jgi:CheY-like chemotaxis protein
MRILVVEDEPALRSQLREQLVAKGYSVDVAADGETGLHLGREYPMDLAIVDLGLPGLSGLELIRQLRSLQRGFPILILTARDAWQDKVDGLETRNCWRASMRCCDAPPVTVRPCCASPVSRWIPSHSGCAARVLKSI